jgi:hypothetical protein
MLSVINFRMYSSFLQGFSNVRIIEGSLVLLEITYAL